MRASQGNGAFRPTLAGRAGIRAALVLTLGLAFSASARAQVIMSEPERTISVALGTSALFTYPRPMSRASIGDPNVAELVTVSEREILINGKVLGTTTMFIWEEGQAPRIFAIEVTADAPGLERYIRSLFPGEPIAVSATGSTVTLSGRVSTGAIGARAVQIAQATGANVIDNLQAPPLPQVLLQVRFAEVTRTAIQEVGTQIAALNPHRLRSDGDWAVETLSEGLMRLFLLNADAEIGAVIRALKSRGVFRSLAEPNLLALSGRDASFLAGGEFPFPIVQGGAQSGAVTITFKEFGVRLNFTPVVTNTGSIRLRVAPEVSSLDFANGLNFSGFTIPALLTRRADTEVELRDGQHLAIAGLIDNATLDNLTKIPVLGDIPVLGLLFRSKSLRQDRTELLVIVTPRIVQPSDVPPPIPTGEPETWRWDPILRDDGARPPGYR